MHIAFIIDDWGGMNPENNSTLRIIHEACVRGYMVAILYPHNLTIRNNVVYGFFKVI